MFQCRSQNTPFETPMRLDCCDDGDFCNQKLKPSIPQKDISRYHTRRKCCTKNISLFLFNFLTFYSKNSSLSFSIIKYIKVY